MNRKIKWIAALAGVIMVLFGGTFEAKAEQTEYVHGYPSTSGALHVEGEHLMDSNGDVIQLQGISSHGLAWFPDYINESAFEQFRQEWNVNVMRIAMYTAEYGGYCAGGDQENLKQLIKNGVEYASENDMYVIVDWHILSDGNPNTYKAEAAEFFAEMSTAFAEQENVIYEICNEPNGGTSWQEIKAYALEIIPVIRANDEDAVIVVGTSNWSQYVDQAAADPITEYDNIMYALHFYAATHKEDLRNTMVSAVESGLPVFVTEYGICDASGNGEINEAEADAWVDAMNAYGISYVAWNLSNKDESSSMLSSSCTKVSDFTYEDLSQGGRWLYGMLNAAESEQTVSDEGASELEVDYSESTLEKETEPITTGEAEWVENALKYAAEVKNSWESNGQFFYQYEVALENFSNEALSSWTIQVPFNENFELSDGWNGDYTVKDNSLEIQAKDYNGTVAPGGKVNDIGFIICGSRNLEIQGGNE